MLIRHWHHHHHCRELLFCTRWLDTVCAHTQEAGPDSVPLKHSDSRRLERIRCGSRPVRSSSRRALLLLLLLLRSNWRRNLQQLSGPRQREGNSFIYDRAKYSKALFFFVFQQRQQKQKKQRGILERRPHVCARLCVRACACVTTRGWRSAAAAAAAAEFCC